MWDQKQRRDEKTMTREIKTSDKGIEREGRGKIAYIGDWSDCLCTDILFRTGKWSHN